jgi:hypothetical protein
MKLEPLPKGHAPDVDGCTQAGGDARGGAPGGSARAAAPC